MIQEFDINQRKMVIPLFNEHTHLTSIIKSILDEGWGKIYVENPENPQIALLSHASFYILAGNSKHKNAREILSYIPHHKIILIPNDDWVELLKKYWGIRLVEKKNDRTKFVSSRLNLNHIKKFKEELPKGLIIEHINPQNAQFFDKTMKEIFFFLFGSLEVFFEKGFGFCIREGDNIIGGATTGNPIYDNTFEVQVYIKKEYRRKGLATILCAYLIEYSLENGIEPHWDAENKKSVKLALKLGYTDPEPYSYYFHTKIPVIILRKLKINKLIFYLLKILGKIDE